MKSIFDKSQSFDNNKPQERKIKFNKEDNSFRLPVEMNVPVGVETKINKELKDDALYRAEKNRVIRKAFDNVNSTIRKVAGYITSHISLGGEKEVSYAKMASEISVPENSVRGAVALLNSFDDWGITMIPVREKFGWIQMATNNEEDYEAWDRKKGRAISTMETVKNKGEIMTRAKRIGKEIPRRKNRIKINENNK